MESRDLLDKFVNWRGKNHLLLRVEVLELQKEEDGPCLDLKRKKNISNWMDWKVNMDTVYSKGLGRLIFLGTLRTFQGRRSSTGGSLLRAVFCAAIRSEGQHYSQRRKKAQQTSKEAWWCLGCHVTPGSVGQTARQFQQQIFQLLSKGPKRKKGTVFLLTYLWRMKYFCRTFPRYIQTLGIGSCLYRHTANSETSPYLCNT